MADYRTEEEQIEILKKWWQENGRSTVAGVCIALVGYFGWAGWHSHQQSRIEAAADLYQQMVAAQQDSASDKGKVATVAGQLRQDSPDSVYAVFAALHLAKNAVDAKDLAQAVEQLNWAREHKLDAALVPLVSLRLAEVQYAQGQADAAMATLAGVKDPGVWKAAFAELRGDLLQGQGQPDKAREAYNEALKALDDSGASEHRQSVEMKLADLSQPAAVAPASAPKGDKS